MDKCWTKRARGIRRCHESLQLPGLHVEELWPHFPPLKMSVWLQMKHLSVKWSERSRSNCWIETCNYASSFSLSHISTVGASLEGRRLQSGLQQKETVCSEGSEDRTPKVAPESKEKTKSEIPVSSVRKKWKLVLLPGRIPLFWCFYSNSFHVPILPSCRVLIMQHVEKADKCQMQYDC